MQPQQTLQRVEEHDEEARDPKRSDRSHTALCNMTPRGDHVAQTDCARNENDGAGPQ